MDYTNLYSTRIQKTFDEDQADIFYAIREELAKNPKLEVQLINYHKGLPVSYNANIVAVDKGALELDVTPHQAVTISTERYTFLRSKLFKFPILARAQYVSVKHKAISLRKLCFVEIMAERRKHLRLELDPPINALFNSSTGIVKGKLIELSMGGAVISVSQSLEEVLGEEISLSLMVPDAEQNTVYNMKLPAKIVKVSEEKDQKRYIFSINTEDKISDRVIAKYLFNRQVEIIRELKEASDVGEKSTVVALN